MSDRNQDASLGDVVEYVKAYAQQETIGPLKGAGRWLGFGAAAAFAMGLGLVMILLGLLRLLQREFDRLATGSLSWLSYLIVLVVCGILIGLTVWRINKKYLNKEDQP